MQTFTVLEWWCRFNLLICGDETMLLFNIGRSVYVWYDVVEVVVGDDDDNWEGCGDDDFASFVAVDDDNDE